MTRLDTQNKTNGAVASPGELSWFLDLGMPLGTLPGSPGNGHGSEPARAPEAFQQCSQAQDGIGGSCPEQRQKLDFEDPCGSFPAQEIP